VRIDDWSLRLAGDIYTTHVAAGILRSRWRSPRRPTVLLQGVDGTSRKGPREAQASFYYSRPQLGVTGTLSVDERTHAYEVPRGSIMNGRANISPPKRADGIGSASISTTAAR
jgi:predicted secreted hydrolase